MNWARVVWREIFGLFVDDGWFALSLAVWLLLTGLLLPALGLSASWSGMILVSGLTIILLESVVRRARA